MKVENGFTPMVVHLEGVEPFPLTAAGSPLAQPEVMDALDAVDRVSHPPRSNESSLTTPEIPFDLDLASKGLKMLRDELLGDSSNRLLRTRVTDTIPRLSGYVEQQNESEQTKASSIRAAESTRRAQEAEAARKAQERGSKRARQAEQRQHFQETAARKSQEAPHLDFTNFLELGELLVVDVEPTGLVARKEKPYKAGIDRQVEAYLEDPEALVNDLRVLALVGGEAIRSTGEKPAGEEGEISIYAKTIFDSISSLLLNKRYSVQALTPEVTAKWLGLATSLPPAIPANGHEEVQEFIHGHGEGNFTPTGLAMMYGRRILLNSLQDIVSTHPKHFIDKAYMIGMQGLDPEDQTKLRLTVGLLQQCLLNQRRAGNIVYISIGAKDPIIQKKAIDLTWTLNALAIPHSTLFGGVNVADKSKGNAPESNVDITLDKSLAKKLYPSVRASPDKHTMKYDAGRTTYTKSIRYGQTNDDDKHPHIVRAEHELTKYVNSPAGSNTLFGRIRAFQKEQEQRQAVSLAARSLGTKIIDWIKKPKTSK